MIYGYARISDKSQNIESQVEELKSHGCDKIFEEIVTGISKEKKLNDLIESTVKGDSIAVTRVDRLGRRTLQILQLIEELEERGVSLVVLNLGMDTSSPIGKAVLSILAAFSEMEREIDRTKQRSGIESAKKKGKHLGRKPNYTKEGLVLAVQMYNSNQYTVSQIEAATQVSRASLYRQLKKEKMEI